MSDEAEKPGKVEKPGTTEPSGKAKKSNWWWPLGVAMTGVAGAGLLVLRGCWHRKMSWPVRAQGHAYQVCMGCGVKRRFDEGRFRAHGPFRYDLNELIAWSKKDAAKEMPVVKRPAS
jgi:hypothetical protein